MSIPLVRVVVTGLSMSEIEKISSAIPVLILHQIEGSDKVDLWKKGPEVDIPAGHSFDLESSSRYVRVELVFGAHSEAATTRNYYNEPASEFRDTLTKAFTEFLRSAGIVHAVKGSFDWVQGYSYHQD